VLVSHIHLFNPFLCDNPIKFDCSFNGATFNKYLNKMSCYSDTPALKFRTGELVKPFTDLIANSNNTDLKLLSDSCCLSAVGVASSGGDFMSDLFNKLSMRRKGEKSLSC